MDRRLERFVLPAHPLLISPQRFLGPGVLDRDPYPLPVRCQASSPRGDTRPLARSVPLYRCMANPQPRVSSIFRSPAVVAPLELPARSDSITADLFTEVPRETVRKGFLRE